MTSWKTKLSAGLFAALTLAGSTLPAGALTLPPIGPIPAPMPAQAVPSAPDGTAVDAVQYRVYDRDGRRVYRDGYYNGYRGYRYHRPGYRYHNGFWFPLGAFAAGALLGGALAAPSAPRRVYIDRLSPQHVDWCYDRYRSYRGSDNTFQPNYGPRKQCISPYY